MNYPIRIRRFDSPNQSEKSCRTPPQQAFFSASQQNISREIRQLNPNPQYFPDLFNK